MNSIVSTATCPEYEIDRVRQALQTCLQPLGGMERFVQPGMRVLLKPNLLAAADLERAVTTHPMVVQAVGEMVQAAGGTVWIGDSPAGSVNNTQKVWAKSGMLDVAAAVGGELMLFDAVTWKQMDSRNYFIARPVLEADLVINLPKIKTHSAMLYTGAVKNLLGVVPGTRKSEMHMLAPGMKDFGRELVNLLDILRPGLTIMDGIWGLEGNGPGAAGTPHAYRCLAASTDPVALDSVITRAMGYRPGEVEYLAQAAGRGLGNIDPALIYVNGLPGVLDFGKLTLPTARWYMQVPSWVSAPIKGSVQLKPAFSASACNRCGKCVQVCPGKALTAGKPPLLDSKRCIGCMCCGEVCLQAAITPQRGRLGRLVGLGG